MCALDSDICVQCPAPDSQALTPAFAQYAQFKHAYPGCLLFFQMGDFFELFFEDALAASQALDITLTYRGQVEGRKVPMCGVPLHASEGYLARLLEKGFKIVVCEQVAPREPQNGKTPKLLERRVRQVVTPGTAVDDFLLAPSQNTFLLCLVPLNNQYTHTQHKRSWGAALVDVSTGAVLLEKISGDLESAHVWASDPRELLVPFELLEEPELATSLQRYSGHVSTWPMQKFAQVQADEKVARAYRVLTSSVIGVSDAGLQITLAVALDYLEVTQGQMPLLCTPQILHNKDFLQLDGFSRRNLEVFESLQGGREHTLLKAIDRTHTAAGARLLAQRLALPLCECEPLNVRLDSIAYLLDHPNLMAKVSSVLKDMPDIERALRRVLLGRLTPRDLGVLAQALRILPTAVGVMQSVQEELSQELTQACEAIDLLPELAGRMTCALAEALPAHTRDGGCIAEGYDEALDVQRALWKQSDNVLAQMAQDYREQLGVPTLKISSNGMLGYYIEVSKRYAHLVPDTFTLRHSLAQAARYSTPELLRVQDEMQHARARALSREQELIDALASDVCAASDALMRTAGALAVWDVSLGLAVLAQERGYTRPILERSNAFDVRKGRHPILEQTCASDKPFVSNDCQLGAQQTFMLLTGPNMAGKSTYLRQNALIVLLAHIGSFVPAERAVIGCVDRLFSRLGASDNLAHGQSTFMVEMVEAATILNQASAQSFVVLDEVGRGTSTRDGLAIAGACVEFMANALKSRCLFATHYHELTALEEAVEGVVCWTPRVKIWQDKVVFLHEIGPGKAEQSYGIQIAQMAGVPAPVIALAKARITPDISVKRHAV